MLSACSNHFCKAPVSFGTLSSQDSVTTVYTCIRAGLGLFSCTTKSGITTARKILLSKEHPFFKQQKQKLFKSSMYKLVKTHGYGPHNGRIQNKLFLSKLVIKMLLGHRM